jgi:hypothetical protein
MKRKRVVFLPGDTVITSIKSYGRLRGLHYVYMGNMTWLVLDVLASSHGRTAVSFLDEKRSSGWTPSAYVKICSGDECTFVRHDGAVVKVPL